MSFSQVLRPATWGGGAVEPTVSISESECEFYTSMQIIFVPIFIFVKQVIEKEIHMQVLRFQYNRVLGHQHLTV